ncbi:hypothetical protein SpCBS45565_g03980 [Spizellomyces sp. 'palustris']|nr:hypothetical protein SpCBS45565_g03980 [Spizellomyces sp. 'palustris']
MPVAGPAPPRLASFNPHPALLLRRPFVEGKDSDELTQIQKLHLFRLEMETRYRPNPFYMEDVQRGSIGTDHRRELIEWLLELARHFRYYCSETFQLSVSILDRICSIESLQLSHYQALGAASFLIASKICEPRTPTCVELEELAAGAFNVEGLKAMELWVLQMLNWNLNGVTPNMFLEFFLDLFEYDATTKSELFLIADQILNRIQPYYHYVRFRPSVQAAAALRYAFETIGINIHDFHVLMGRELESQSLHTVAIVSSLDIPQMLEVNRCAAAMVAQLARNTFPHVTPMHSRGKTHLHHGLATPAEDDEGSDEDGYRELDGPVPFFLAHPADPHQYNGSATGAIKQASSPFA